MEGLLGLSGRERDEGELRWGKELAKCVRSGLYTEGVGGRSLSA
jgi:hypothetical protein